MHIARGLLGRDVPRRRPQAEDIEFLLGPNTLQCNSPTTATLWKRSTQGSGEIEKVSTGLARIKLLSADTLPLCGGYVWTARIIDGGESKTAASGSVRYMPSACTSTQ